MRTNWCDSCAKVSYDDRLSAEEKASEITDKRRLYASDVRLRAYQCMLGKWHLTKRPLIVSRGRRAAAR